MNIHVVISDIEKHPVCTGDLTLYRIIDIAPSVVFLQLATGKKAIFVANGKVHKTSVVRLLVQTERGVYFETDNVSYVQQRRPLGA